MIEAGFPIVFEQFDGLGHVVENRIIEDRLIACFVGVKLLDDEDRDLAQGDSTRSTRSASG